jgi:hypothetical protein
MKLSSPARSRTAWISGTALLAIAALGTGFAGCTNDDSTTGPTPVTPVGPTIKAYSSTPAFAEAKIAGVSVYTLLSSDDTLSESPSFVFGGSADGAGLIKNSDGTFTYLVNNEDNWSVARIKLDSSFKPVKGDYVVNSTAGNSRLCSGTMATPAEHGFGPLFLSGAESGIDRGTYSLAINPNGAANSAKYLTKLGLFNSENLVPLPKTAYTGKTVILMGNDNSAADGGQVALYVSNVVGDLDGGKVYALARTDSVTKERAMVTGTTYNVVFKEVTNPSGKTKTTMADTLNAMKVIKFGRVEDLDYGKAAGTSRDVYFTVTGQPFTGVNADSSRTRYGRVYKLTMSESNPLVGTLEVILDGDVRPGTADKFQDPDNIVVTKNYVYIQEDPNTYGDETHDAYIYQYNIATKALTVAFELNHHRGDAAYQKYNMSRVNDTTYTALSTSSKGSWEYGALIDISDIVGIDDVFMLSVQPHSWVGRRYKNADGGTLATSESQGSQILLIKGLPR